MARLIQLTNAERSSDNVCLFFLLHIYWYSPIQGWKLKPKPENPVLKEILETQIETDTYKADILKT